MRTRDMRIACVVGMFIAVLVASDAASAQGPLRRLLGRKRACCCTCEQQVWCEYQHDVCVANSECDPDIRCELLKAACLKYKVRLRNCRDPGIRSYRTSEETCADVAQAIYANCCMLHNCNIMKWQNLCRAQRCTAYWQCQLENPDKLPGDPPENCF